MSRERAIHKYLHKQKAKEDKLPNGRNFDLLLLCLEGFKLQGEIPQLKGMRLMFFEFSGIALDRAGPIKDGARRKRIVAQILSALTLLHSLRPFAICHRDIKPSNVICNVNTWECVNQR